MPVRKEHEQDILLVRNIDIECEDHSTEIIKTTRQNRDEETGAATTEYIELTDEFDHQEFYQVKWGGQRFRIAPGQTRRMPRFVAEHYAKHLADHILSKREIDEKRTGLINHPSERPKTIQKILIGVDSFWNDLGELDEGTQALQQVEELNSRFGADVGLRSGQKSVQVGGELDAGDVSRDHFRAGEEIKSTEEILAEASLHPENKEDNQGLSEDMMQRTNAELISEIRQMDPTYKLTGKENKMMLASILRRF